MRFPQEDRLLSTLDDLKVSTAKGMVPLSNFITRRAAPKLAEIDRRDGERYFLIRAGVDEATSDIARIEEFEQWIAEEAPFPGSALVTTRDHREASSLPSSRKHSSPHTNNLVRRANSEVP